MGQKVTSIKMDEEMIAALDLMAQQQGTTRHALVCEAVEAVLSGGMEKVLQDKITGCLSHILGFNSKDGFNEAVEAKFGSMLVDLIDARLKVLFSIDLNEELQEGSLAALMQEQTPMLKPKPGIDIQKALGLLEEQLGMGDIPLDQLATILDVDKQMLSRELSKAGIKTERKRVGGERMQFYMQGQLGAVKSALEGNPA